MLHCLSVSFEEEPKSIITQGGKVATKNNSEEQVLATMNNSVLKQIIPVTEHSSQRQKIIFA